MPGTNVPRYLNGFPSISKCGSGFGVAVGGIAVIVGMGWGEAVEVVINIVGCTGVGFEGCTGVQAEIIKLNVKRHTIDLVVIAL